MKQRFDMEVTYPEAWKGLYAFSLSLHSKGLTPVQKELIKIRASQLNACAFCLDMHTKDALKLGETPQRMFLLNAWRDTDLFTEEEKAILATTEEVTLIHQHGISEESWANARRLFRDEVIAEIIMAAVTINAWNRVAISTQKPIAG